MNKWECDKIIEYGKSRIEKAKVASSYGENKYHKGRTNSSCAFNEPFDLELKGVREFIKSYISEKTNLPIENQEQIGILNYQIGEYYDTHGDFFEKDDVELEEYKLAGGQRLYSILIYLNDVEEGGELEYPNLEL